VVVQLRELNPHAIGVGLLDYVERIVPQSGGLFELTLDEAVELVGDSPIR
jgi:hypothetical protein